MENVKVILSEGLKPIGYLIKGNPVSLDMLGSMHGISTVKSLYDNSLRLSVDGKVLKLPMVINVNNKVSKEITTPIMLVERYVDGNGNVIGYLTDVGGYKVKLPIMDIVRLSEVAIGTGNYYVSQKAGKHYLVSKGNGIKLSDLPTTMVASSDATVTGKERQKGVHIGVDKGQNKDTSYSIFDLCNTLVDVGGVLVRLKGSSYKTIGDRTSDIGSRFISKGIEIARPQLTPSHKGLNVNLSFKQLGSLNTRDVLDGVNVVDTFVYKTRALVTGDIYNFANNDKSDLYVCVPVSSVERLKGLINGTDLALMLEPCDNVLIGTSVQAEGYIDDQVVVFGLNTRGLTGIVLNKCLDVDRLCGVVKLRSDLTYIRKKLKSVLKGYEAEDKENSYGGLIYAAHLDKYDINTLTKLQELGIDLKTGAYIDNTSYSKVGKSAVDADIKGISSLEWGYTGVLTDKTSKYKDYVSKIFNTLKNIDGIGDLKYFSDSLDGKGLGITVLQTFGVMDTNKCLGEYSREVTNITGIIKRLLATVIKYELGLDYNTVHKVVQDDYSNQVSDIYLGVILGIIEHLISLRCSLSCITSILRGVIRGLDTAINILDYDLCVANTYISKQADYFNSNNWEDITSARQKTGKKYSNKGITVIVK